MAAVIRTVSGSAALCTRAAMFGVSPEDVLHRPPTVRHDRRSRVQADPHLQRNDRLGGAPVEALHGLDNGQPGAHGPFGVVLVRLGHPKETHQAVAEELIDVAPQAGHGRGGRFLVRF